MNGDQSQKIITVTSHDKKTVFVCISENIMVNRGYGQYLAQFDYLMPLTL